MTNAVSQAQFRRAHWVIPGAFVLVKLLIHLPVLHRFGYHHDELYFLACGHHPAFGYVDHAPLVPWIALLADTLFGQSLFGLRVFSTLAGAVTLLLTGLLVHRLGGGRFAQFLACLAMLVAPVYLRTGNMLCIPAFEPLFWVIGFHLLVRIIQEDNPKLWPWVGLVAGLGLMNKHSMLFFGFGLTVALALTRHRKHFRSPWLYAGGAVAFLIFLPNLVWQATNDWATLQFLRGLNQGTMSGIPAVMFVVGQLLYHNPLSAIVWVAGLLYLFFAEGRRYALFGWMYVAIFVLLVGIKSKIYYLSPVYPILFAAGSLALERIGRRPGQAWIRPAVAVAVFVNGCLLAPLSVPILSLDATERFVTAMTFGAMENVYELTGDLRGMFGWKERVAAIAEVYKSLPLEERERAVIFTGSYGMAGAVDYFGGEHVLPKAVSGHMTYHLWGLPDHPIDTVVAAYIGQEHYDRFNDLFESVEVAKTSRIYPDHMTDERPFRVFLCRGAKVDLHDIWSQARSWD
jgi:hypothetical protein